jgi:hypothetical protein
MALSDMTAEMWITRKPKLEVRTCLVADVEANKQRETSVQVLPGTHCRAQWPQSVPFALRRGFKRSGYSALAPETRTSSPALR